MIGIVGGMGPYTGLDLAKKIFDLTDAKSDQDHFPVSMISVPDQIEDRTKFLLDPILDNPGIAIGKVVRKLAESGATVIGMPCNTAHSPLIFKEIEKQIPHGILFVHMIEEVLKWIKGKYPNIKNVGILATSGTIQSQVYHDELIQSKLEPITLPESVQRNCIDEAIYNESFGIKAISSPVSKEAVQQLESGISSLIESGAECVILGCTEIPIAIQESMFQTIPLVDSTHVLAHALISKSNPELLKL